MHKGNIIEQFDELDPGHLFLHLLLSWTGTLIIIKQRGAKPLVQVLQSF